jgi:hypothetical protein
VTPIAARRCNAAWRPSANGCHWSVIAICVVLFTVGVLRGEAPLLMALDRDQPGRGGHPRGAASHRDSAAGAGCAQDGDVQRADSPPAFGRNPRLGHLHLFGQDRHADAEPHARRDAAGRWRNAGSRATPRPGRCTRSCCAPPRLCNDATPTDSRAAGRGTRPRPHLTQVAGGRRALHKPSLELDAQRVLELPFDARRASA